MNSEQDMNTEDNVRYRRLTRICSALSNESKPASPLISNWRRIRVANPYKRTRNINRESDCCLRDVCFALSLEKAQEACRQQRPRAAQEQIKQKLRLARIQKKALPG